MEDKLKTAQRRAAQYWFVDGLAEISGGIICLMLAIYFATLQLLPETVLVDLISFVIIIGVTFGVRSLMERLRSKVTYPKTGYVAPKGAWDGRKLLIITIIFAIFILTLQVYLIFIKDSSLGFTAFIGGFIFAFVFAMTGFQTRLGRFIYLAIGCMALSLALTFLGLGNFWGAAMLSLIVSLILFAYGSLTRQDFLRQLKANAESSHGE
jgi:hypothetical protein